VKGRIDQLRIISEVGQHITSVLDSDELLQQIAGSIREAFGYYLVEIGLIEGDELVFKARADRNGEIPFQSFRIRVGCEGVTGWVAAVGEPLAVPDVSSEPRYVSFSHHRTRSELAVPIKAQDRVIGVINVQDDKLGAFDDDDVTVLQQVANQAAIALENARLFAQEQRRAEQFRVIAEVGRRLGLTLDIDDVLTQVAQLIQQGLGYYHVGIGLIEGNEVVYRVGAGELWDDPHFQFRPGRLRVGQEGLTGWVAARGEPLLVQDVSQEPRYVWMKGSRTHSELVIPIMVKGQTIGVLDAQSDRLNGFDESDQAILQSVASQASTAIENARLYKQAHQRAVVEERSRLARELHDSVSQALYGITLYAQAAAGHLAACRLDKVSEQLSAVQDTSQDALAEMRLLIFELRPSSLDEAGLSAALQARLLAVEGRAGLKTVFTSDLTDRLRLDVEEGLYRIAQEALNNCLKHAAAHLISVSLCRQGSRITMTIVDDGVGFDVGAARDGGGVGLQAMAERAAQLEGQLRVNSQPGAGTEVRVEVDV